MKLTIESKGEFKKINAWISEVINRSPVEELRKVADSGTTNLKNNTPKNTGETASGWISEITTYKGNSVVEWLNIAHPDARVNIARIIDRGHGTGTGGYVPPIPYIEKSMSSIWKSTDDMVRELIK